MSHTKRSCDHCGKEYQADNRNLKRGWGLCCSKSCAAKKREIGNGHKWASKIKRAKSRTTALYDEDWYGDYDPGDSEYWDRYDEKNRD